MGLEPEGDSTVVWRHLPVDTKKRDACHQDEDKMQCCLYSILRDQNELERFYNQQSSTTKKTLGNAAVSFILKDV